MERIIVNKIQCKHCGDIIESKHVHNFVTCSCQCCSVDGGHYYLSRSYRNNTNDFIELSIVEEIEE